MAKNYTFAEAVRIINAGTDMESITDIGRRYPILMHKVATVCAKAGDAFVDLMSYMPEYLTANKVNTALKNAAGADTEAEDTDNVGEPDTNDEATEETTETGAQDFESMSGKELWDLLGKAGKRKLAKSTKKADLVEACKQAFGAGATEDEAEDETDEADTEANPYEGKSAMELFKECKKRGIKAAPKKTAKFYADLLVKNDAEASEETESESDDWDEDEAPAKEEPKAKKATKKAEKTEEKKPAKKAAKKEEPADDDDDWDI
jgi:hypothetical protein